VELGLRDDGTAWAAGQIPYNFFGYFDPRWNTGKKLVRLDDATKHSFIQIQGEWNGIVGLASDGTILESQLYGMWGMGLAGRGKVWQPSKYTDWIAVECRGFNLFSGLAADGTLTLWRDPSSEGGGRLHALVLVPSRAPICSINVLSDADHVASRH
jgi:hypothetical protein